MQSLLSRSSKKYLSFPVDEYRYHFKNNPIGFSLNLAVQHAIGAYCSLLCASLAYDIAPNWHNTQCQFSYNLTEQELAFINAKNKSINFRKKYLINKNNLSDFVISIEKVKGNLLINMEVFLNGPINKDTIDFLALYMAIWQGVEKDFPLKKLSKKIIDKRKHFIYYPYGLETQNLTSEDISILIVIYNLESNLVSVDDILFSIGVKPTLNGRQKRGGYNPAKRKSICNSIDKLIKKEYLRASLCNVTDNIAEQDYTYMVVPPVFDETFLIASEILKYGDVKHLWERKISLFLYKIWANNVHLKDFKPIRIEELLNAVDVDVKNSYPSRLRARLEKVLDKLLKDEIIAGWQYYHLKEDDFFSRSEVNSYIQNHIIIEPPLEIINHYTKQEVLNINLLKQNKDILDLNKILEQMKLQRVTQLMLAETLEMPLSTLSKILTGKRRPSVENFNKLVDWLNCYTVQVK